MKINVSKKVVGTKLVDTDGGDTFFYGGQLWVASDRSKTKYGTKNILCVDLRTGSIMWLDETMLVTVVDTRVEENNE